MNIIRTLGEMMSMIFPLFFFSFFLRFCNIISSSSMEQGIPGHKTHTILHKTTTGTETATPTNYNHVEIEKD